MFKFHTKIHNREGINIGYWVWKNYLLFRLGKSDQKLQQLEHKD